jgi:hypothetical protein
MNRKAPCVTSALGLISGSLSRGNLAHVEIDGPLGKSLAIGVDNALNI